MRLFACAVLLTALAALPAHAQGEDGPAIDPDALTRDTVTIGAGVGVAPSYEGSDDYVLIVMPAVRGRVSGINFTLRGNRASADLIADGAGTGWDFQLGPVAQANFNRTSGIKDAQVKALGKLSTAIELGGYVGIGYKGLITSDYDELSVSLAYAHDVRGVHGSYILSPSLDYSTPLSTKAFVGLNVSGDYMGDGYADTYFGVTPAGSIASGLPAYSASKGWKDWTVAAYGAVSLTGDLTHGLALVAGGSYRRLLDDAAASPVTSIAGSRNQWIGAAGLAYTF